MTALAFATRDEAGFLLRSVKDVGGKSIAISHGTVSSPLSDKDSIYKNIIADAVFTGECAFTAVQSRICMNSVDALQPAGLPLETGNLIFASAKKVKRCIPVTSKAF